MHRKELWSFVATILLLGSPSPAAARSPVAYGMGTRRYPLT
jgi:hypothetical protein